MFKLLLKKAFFCNAIICCLFTQIAFAKIDLDFSHKRGYYSNGFQLTIASSNPNAIIKYTTNKSKPSASSGNTYNGPINISGTTLIRAYAYTGIDESNVRTHSYLFFNDIIGDQNMYTYITQDAVYGAQMETSLKALPVISLVSNTINEATGIPLETETSVEMFYPDNSRDGFMVHSGIQTWGGSATNPKKHYRLEFKSIYGTPKLEYKIFKADNYDNTEYKIQPAEKFNKLLLRSGSQDGLNAEYGHELRAQYVRNRFLFDVQMEMGYPAPHGRFVHVFVNGDYSGQYQLMERPDANFFESYYGGDELDYEVYKSDRIWDGPFTLNNSIWKSLDSRVNLSSANAIANTNRYIDLDQTAAYLLMMSYASGFDWTESHNCLGGTNITPGNGGYKFIIWDVDFALGNGGKWHPNSAGDVNYFNAPIDQDGPAPAGLVGNVEFNYMMADHMECTCFNDGILTPANVDDMYMHRINQISTSLIAESARWGNYPFSFSSGHVADNNWDVNSEFTTELNTMRNSYFPARTNNMVNYYKSNNLTSDLNAVQFNQYGGLVSQSFSLILSNTNSASNIYYTIDGTDPRAVGGGVSSSAILYNGSVTLPSGPVTIKARVRDTNHSNTSIKKWSAMCPRTFYVNQNYNDIVINEIDYNPKDSIYFNTTINAIDTVSGRNFEFVELKNMGQDPVYLKDLIFSKGISMQFDQNVIIQPNGFVVIAEDAFWFQQKHGFAADATFTGKLDNGGERLWLQDPVGNIIDSLTYNDNLPWDTIPDGGLYSLALIDGLMDNSLSPSWKAQLDYATPNAENNFCIPISNNPNIADVSCKGGADGFITTSLGGGTAPFTYSWSNGQTTSSISNLAAGTYSVTITDAIGCPFNDSITITEPSRLSINVMPTHEAAYQANNGSASVSGSGGTAPYTYSWSTGATSASIINLSPASYSVTVTDANMCTITKSFVINQFDCSAYGINVNKTDETYYQANNGSATALLTGGGSPFTYSWSNGANTAVINNLAQGNYTVTVTNAFGCALTKTVTINSFSCPQLSVSVNQNNESCNGNGDGSLNAVSIQNGVAPYSINWSTGSTNTAINNLTQGSYTLTITDNFQCPFTETFTITRPQPIVISETITNASSTNMPDGSIDITVAGGTAPYTYFWSNSKFTQDISNILPAAYWVNVTDSEGCSQTKSNLQVGIGSTNCLLTLTQTNQPNIASGIEQVAEYIISNGKVNSGVNATFMAGDYIHLRNNFEVILGAEFEARIDGCN